MTYSTRHRCSSFWRRELPTLPRKLLLRQSQAVHQSRSGGGPCPAASQARDGAGHRRPTRLAQSRQQSGSCPTPQCPRRAHGAARPSASAPLSSPAFPQPPPPAAAQASRAGVGLAGTPGHPVPPARTALTLLPCALPGWGEQKAPELPQPAFKAHLDCYACFITIIIIIIVIYPV